MDYRRASTTELIDALCEQERLPDLKLIQALLERGNDVVPELIEVVECDTDWPQVHAALLLCELQAESALPALRRAISMPERHGLADWLADDALEKFGSAALDMLEAVAADKTVEWYPRAVACRVMRTIALRHPETHDRVMVFLRGLLPDPDLDWRAYESYEALKEAVDDPQVWTSVVGQLCDLRDPEAYALIGQLFQAGLVNEMVFDPASYQEAYQQDGLPWGFKEKPQSLLDCYERSRPPDRRGTQGTRRIPRRSKRRKRKKRRRG